MIINMFCLNHPTRVKTTDPIFGASFIERAPAQGCLPKAGFERVVIGSFLGFFYRKIVQAGYFQGCLVLCKTAVVTKACRQGGRPEAAAYNLFKI